MQRRSSSLSVRSEAAEFYVVCPVSAFDGGCAKLTRDAEVIVESKDRKKPVSGEPEVIKGCLPPPAQSHSTVTHVYKPTSSTVTHRGERISLGLA